MIRKTMIGLVVLAGLTFLMKKTSFISYAGTLWSQATRQAKEQVPTKFEIERARREISAMEADISGALRPIAEYMAAIGRLKKDIKSAGDALGEQKASILAMTRDLEGNPTVLTYGGEEFTAERVRKKLQSDFDSYRRCEAHLKSQQNLLESRERSLTACREQLSKLVAKKREYEMRLAGLEADEETLQTARIGSKMPLPDNRAAEIEGILSEIEHRQDVQRAEIELANGPQAHDFIPVQREARTSPADLNEIRNYFGQRPEPKTTTRN